MKTTTAAGKTFTGQQPGASNGTAPSLPQITYDTKFNQGYRMASAVNGGGEITAVANNNGQVELFTLGTDGTIWNFYPDATSDTGYSGVSTQLKASTFSVGADSSGNIVVFAAFGLQLNYLVENPGGSSRWGTPAVATVPQGNTALAIAKVVVENIGNNLYVGVLTQLKNIVANTYSFAYSNWQTANPQFQSTSVIFSGLNCVWFGNNAQPVAFANVSQAIITYALSTGSVTSYNLSTTLEIVGIDTAVDASGNNQLFAVLGDGNVYHIAAGTSGQPWYAVQLSTGMNFRQVLADSDASGNVHVFGVSGDNSLYHWEADANNQTGYSYPPAPIQPAVALAGIATNDQGNIELFTIGTAQNNLNHLSFESSSGNWLVNKLEVPTAGALEQYISYSTDIHSLDTTGVPLVNSPVSIWASELTTIRVNGSSFLIGPNKPARTSTNNAGVLSVSQEAGSLTVPVLDINFTNIMQPGQTLTVQQFAGTQQSLATVQGPDLMNAKDQSGNYLLQDQYRTTTTTNSMATAFNQCMSMAAAPVAATQHYPTRHGNVPGVWLKNETPVTEFVKMPPLLTEQHWQLSFEGNDVIYRDLPSNEVKALLAHKRATTLSAAGVFDWLDDIGDFFEAVGNGIASVVDVVVTTIANGVNAAITFIIDGVTYLFEAAITLIEQAFDLVSAIFAKVQVFLEKVWEWIGFLFAWDDILRTKQAIAYSINQYLGFAQGSIAGIQTIVDNGFANFQSQIAAVFQQAIKNIAGSSSLGGYNDANQPAPTPQFAGATSNNIAYNGLVNNMGGGIATLSAAPLSADDPLQQLLTQLKGLGDFTESQATFEQAVTYFSNLGGNPDEIFSQLLAGLFSLAEAILQAIISGVKVVVDALFALAQTIVGLIQQSLNESWNIPIISDLYKLITNGDELTTLDLISLILAIPVTFTYKIVYSSAPFADSASVTAFCNSFNTQTMLQSAGFGSKANGLRAAATENNTVPVYQTFFAVGGALSVIFGGWLTAVNDGIPKPPSGLSKAILVFESAAQLCSFPWFYSSGAPSCDPANPKGCAKTVWIYQNVGVLMDAVFIKLEGHIPESANDAGVGIQFVYALAHLALSIVASINASGLDVAANILPVIPELCKLLRLTKIVAVTEGISLPVLAAVDALVYTASGIIGFIAATGSNDAAPAPAPQLILN